MEWRHPWDGFLHGELPGGHGRAGLAPLPFDSAGNLYVPDGRTIHRWNKSGAYIGTFGPDRGFSPVSVAFDDKGFPMWDKHATKSGDLSVHRARPQPTS